MAGFEASAIEAADAFLGLFVCIYRVVFLVAGSFAHVRELLENEDARLANDRGIDLLLEYLAAIRAVATAPFVEFMVCS